MTSHARSSQDPAVMERRAYFSADRRHRLLLTRRWDDEPSLTWIMLNPSVADGERDDATMRRVIDYTRRWGFGGCRVVNLFTLITPSPRVLAAAVKTGEINHVESLRTAIKLSRRIEVVVAWGAITNRTLVTAAPPVASWAQEHDVSLRCLGTTLRGEPLHPLRLNGQLQLREWRP